VQALGAGEGVVALPAVTASVGEIKSKGAPLGTVTPDFTTGVEMQIVLSSRTKTKHPAAARLFANYLMSPEGNKVFNDDPGGVTMYDTSGLPRQYESPKPNALARRELVIKLLGF
jgi:iron(III) transport system substrate-binding protein